MSFVKHLSLLLLFLGFHLASVGQARDQHGKLLPSLDSVEVVPNHFYSKAFDFDKQGFFHISIRNLPGKCKVTIYSFSGGIIRSYDNPAGKTEWKWDLKNDHEVPVESGVYIVHVDAGEQGKRNLKLFVFMATDDGPTTY